MTDAQRAALVSLVESDGASEVGIHPFRRPTVRALVREGLATVDVETYTRERWRYWNFGRDWQVDRVPYRIVRITEKGRSVVEEIPEDPPRQP